MSNILTLRNNTFELMSSRAVFWVDQKTLLVSDLHWGKEHHFAAVGIPLPDQLRTAELARLGELVRATQVERILVLGDLVHSARAISAEFQDEIFAWAEIFSG